MAASLFASALLLVLVTRIAGEVACPAGTLCTTVEPELSGNLQLLQVSFSMQSDTVAAAAGTVVTDTTNAVSGTDVTASGTDGTDVTASGTDVTASGTDITGTDVTDTTDVTASGPPNAGKNTCADPGDGKTRIWFACIGGKTSPPTEAEQALGVQVGSNMCCTEEVDFGCLCCTDFTRPLEYTRCGTMSIAAQQRAGAMTDDKPNATTDSSVVLICTQQRAIPKESAPNSTVLVPVQCMPREFTPEELYGTDAESKVGPGQILFDERIMFLMQQGLPTSAIPTCKDTVPGNCPIGTPKAGQKANSAGKGMLSKLGNRSLLEIDGQEGFNGGLPSFGSFSLVGSSW